MLKVHPRNLFLIDCLGALLSTVMLGIVMTKFEGAFGMPQNVLYLLAGIAYIFFIYSGTCYLRRANVKYLKIIAIANLLYCFITTGLAIYFFRELSVLGLIYFVLEILVLVVLVAVELRVALK